MLFCDAPFEYCSSPVKEEWWAHRIGKSVSHLRQSLSANQLSMSSVQRGLGGKKQIVRNCGPHHSYASSRKQHNNAQSRRNFRPPFQNWRVLLLLARRAPEMRGNSRDCDRVGAQEEAHQLTQSSFGANKNIERVRLHPVLISSWCDSSPRGLPHFDADGVS